MEKDDFLPIMGTFSSACPSDAEVSFATFVSLGAIGKGILASSNFWFSLVSGLPFLPEVLTNILTLTCAELPICLFGAVL